MYHNVRAAVQCATPASLRLALSALRSMVVPVRALTQRHALFAKCSYDTSYAAPFVVACTPSLRSAVPAVHSAASIAVAMTVPCPSIPAHYSAWYAYERSSKECARASGMTAFAA